MVSRRKIPALFFLRAAPVFALLSCFSGGAVLKDPPIITSASYQHTLYNGERQPVEITVAAGGAPPPAAVYFLSEVDFLHNRNGFTEPPSETGYYFVRIVRPAGNGFRRGPDVKVEYHIQKALTGIPAESP